MPTNSRVAEKCPWLGSVRDRATIYGYPSEGNDCFSPNRPKQLSILHQDEYCLSGKFGTCPYFPNGAADYSSTSTSATTVAPDEKAKGKFKVKLFSPMGISLFAAAFLVLVGSFLVKADLIPSGAFLVLPTLTPTSNALVVASAKTATRTVAPPSPSPIATAIPSTATAVPASVPTVVVPTNSPTATAIPSTATPLPPIASVTPSPTKPLLIAWRYQPVALLQPRNEQQVNGEAATFEWLDTRLQPGDHYELRLKRFGSQTWEKRYPVAGVKFVWFIQEALGYGGYVWGVLVLDSSDQIVSPMSEERKLSWQPREAPGSQSTSSSPFIKP